mmetsp:Transcript_4217/g.19118  ORF Transcript_4217/g.19118 Transcript_4217/m.19118 type:complete len:231 (+) Transcript_4217:40-732(+)
MRSKIRSKIIVVGVSHGGDFEPLPQEVRDDRRQPVDVLHQGIVRERERVHVLLEHRLTRRERHALHVEHRSLRVVEDDESDEQPAPRSHLAHLPPQRLLLVEPAVGDDQAELLELLGPAADVLARGAELRVQVSKQVDHRGIRKGVVLGKRKLRHQRGSALVGERRSEGMQRAHRVVGVCVRSIAVAGTTARGSKADHANLSNLEPSHRPREQHHGLEREVPASVLSHRL